MWRLAGCGAPQGAGGVSMSQQGPRGGRWSNAGAAGKWGCRMSPKEPEAVWVGVQAGWIYGGPLPLNLGG